MSQIDIRLVQAAVMVADELNFSKAAIRLHLTQPALTKQIQDLEDRLGVVLFERNNQRVILTDPCRIFIEVGRLVLLHLDRAVHLTRAASSGAETVLNFGSAPDTDPYLVSTALASRLPLYPTLRVHASSNFSLELSRHVLTGELDAALVIGHVTDRRLSEFQVVSHPLYAVFRSSEEAAALKSTSLRDFDNRVWIIYGRHVHPTLHDQVLAIASQHKIKPRDFHQVTTPEEATQLINRHSGVAFLIRDGAWRIARDSLTMRPMSEPELRVETSLITRWNEDSQLTSEFVRTLMLKMQPNPKSQQQSLPLDSSPS